MKVNFIHRKFNLSKKKKIIFLSSILLVFILSHLFFTLRTSDKKTLKYFDNEKVPCQIDYIPSTISDHKIRVISTGNKTDKAILFVHGAPGSSNAFYKYLKDPDLLKHAQLISYDRPGYGYSGFGKSMTTTSEHAQIIKNIIEHYKLNNVVVVGHSYGGPIAAYAPLVSHKITAALLIAPAIDPDQEIYYWIGNFAKWKATKWAVPTALVVSADEKYTHEEDMRNLVDEWKNVEVPVVNLQGDKDMLVPHENLRFCEEHFNPKYFTGKTIKDENHFTPWTKKELVVEEILNLL